MRQAWQRIEIEEFRRLLLAWFARFQRDLPWRKTRDPYAIWVSETMLQQTRVAAVIPYYLRFLEQFPNLTALARAPEASLLAAWSGLGYYYRARNLQKAAQIALANGSFPNTYDALRELPGVGDYTAAAVASIAFDLPHAVLDGNVLRVLSRLAADPADIASVAGRKHFAQLAANLLEAAHPAQFNQAMMELGATVCLPKNPQCLVCPAAQLCRARQTGSQTQLPVKSSKQKSVEEQRTLFWIEDSGRVLAWQRPPDTKLMPGFWELPEPAHLPLIKTSGRLGSFRHGITFHNYLFELLEAAPPEDQSQFSWIPLDALSTLPVSTVFKKAKRVRDTLTPVSAKAATRRAGGAS